MMRKKTKTLQYVLPLAVYLLGLAASATADSNLHIGSLEIHPGISAGYRYDDNIYLNDGDIVDEVDDSIGVYSASLGLQYKREKRAFSLDYKAELLDYSKEDREDKTNHTAIADIDLEFPGGLIFKAGGSYLRTADPASTELTRPDKRDQTDGRVEAGWRIFDRLTALAKYRETDVDYKKRSLDNQDREERATGGELQLRLLPKTAFFVEYEKSEIEYRRIIGGDDRDSDSVAYFFGIKGQVTPKIYTNARIGHKEREYSQDTGANAKEDFDATVGDLELKFKASERFSLSIAGHRTIEESFYLQNNYYVENKGDISINYRLTSKVATRLYGYYGRNEYNLRVTDPVDSKLKERDDRLAGGNVDLIYNIRKWLSVNLGYVHKDRDSNFDSEDYTDNQYNASIKLEF